MYWISGGSDPDVVAGFGVSANTAAEGPKFTVFEMLVNDVLEMNGNEAIVLNSMMWVALMLRIFWPIH
eukprot:14032911-Alexandrium_andersonii.AAC.1